MTCNGTLPYVVNDDFGDVAVLTVALIADPAYSMGDRQDVAQHIADMLHQVEGTKKLIFWAFNKSVFFIEIENAKLAQLGIAPDQLIGALKTKILYALVGLLTPMAKTLLFNLQEITKTLPILEIHLSVCLTSLKQYCCAILLK